jgi:nucleotide-binding universal stress UspA family protein
MQSGLKEAQMMCRACKIDCKIEMSQSKQPAAEELIRFAKKKEVDEIVIGLNKRSQLGKLLFGSTSRHVLLEAPCPVLTVK